MEEFRTFADRLVLSLINRGQIGAGDFVERELAGRTDNNRIAGTEGPVVAATDYIKLFAEQIRPFVKPIPHQSRVPPAVADGVAQGSGCGAPVRAAFACLRPSSFNAESPCISPSTSSSPPDIADTSPAATLILRADSELPEPKLECESNAAFGWLPKRLTCSAAINAACVNRLDGAANDAVLFVGRNEVGVRISACGANSASKSLSSCRGSKPLMLKVFFIVNTPDGRNRLDLNTSPRHRPAHSGRHDEHSCVRTPGRNAFVGIRDRKSVV